MSGFDTSQSVTDEAVLDEADVKDDAPKAKAEQPTALSDELGDATPGPR
jgi:hypothetical protein